MNGKRLDVGDIVTLGDEDLSFTVVALLADDEDGREYAILMHEPENDDDETFVVTDAFGELVEDDELAQEVLDDYLFLSEHPEDGET